MRVVRCPFCQSDDDKVVDSRAAEHGAAIRRRRECLACSQRYTTYERVEEVVVLVRKRGGTLESFDGQKLVAGIERAASGRVDDDAVHEIVAQVEAQLRTLGPEVTSDVIGMAVLERLRALDQVAYLRFASVYKGFEDASDFARELGELDKTTAPKPRRTDIPDA